MGVVYPKKKILGLIGPPRCGKDTVAEFLVQNHGYKRLAFADRIKTEYGISIEDFEAAKISGKIEEVRQALWEFSQEKYKDDPQYFIKSVMQEAVNSKQSVIITDIRTLGEIESFYAYPHDFIRKIYFITTDVYNNEGLVPGSKIPYEELYKYFDANLMYNIENIYKCKGLYKTWQRLDHFFFMEDIMDLSSPDDKPDPANNEWRRKFIGYMNQYNISQR